jgi:hypothetical protein
LPERPPQGKLRTDSNYDWREIGEQVSSFAIRGRTLLCIGLAARQSA